MGLRRPVCLAVDRRPALNGTQVAALPVRVAGFKDETGIDDEVKRCLVLKPEVNRMVLSDGEEFHKIHDLAFDLFKAVERASAISANCCLAAFGFSKAEWGRKSLSLLWLFGIAMFAG